MRSISCPRAILCAIGVFSLACPLSADVIHVDTRGFSVFSGGSLDVGADSQIFGGVGGDDYIYIGRDVSVGGDLLGRGWIDVDRDSSVAGRLIAADGLWAGRDSSFGDIQSQGGLSFDRGVSTGSLRTHGYLGIARDMTVDGDVEVGGWLDINRGAHVTGDVYHKSGYWKNNRATVDGEFIEIDQNPQIDEWTWDAPTGEPTSSVHDYDWTGSGAEVYLDPGDYGRMDFGNNVTIHLNGPGEYNFDALWLGNNAKVLGSGSGQIGLNVAGGLTAGNSAEFLFDSDEVRLAVNSGGWTSFGNDAVIQGDLFAFDGGMEFGNNADVSGVVYSADYLSMGSGAVVRGQDKPVAEPACVTMLLMGAGGLILRRPRSLKRR
jgi:hypothetical protein